MGDPVHNYRDMGIKRMKDERAIHTLCNDRPRLSEDLLRHGQGGGTVHQPPLQLVGGGRNSRYHRVEWDIAEGRNYIYHNVGVPFVDIMCVGYRKIYLGLERRHRWAAQFIHIDCLGEGIILDLLVSQVQATTFYRSRMAI
jgi:hypothetical protein